MTKKNILLMGRTGSGKSTLANVLTETNKFKEGQNALSETSKIQVEVFESEGDEYRIIDTAGIGDNRTSIEVFIWQLAMLTKEIKGGVYQMFLVTRGEIEEEVKYAYELVKEILFDNNLAYRTTIIRTRFDNFESSLEKKKDCELFLKANEKNGNFKRDAKIIFDNNSIIHVDNTSISVKVRRKKEEAARDRNISRDIIFEYLKNISCREIYLPKKISLFSKEIEKYLPVDNREYLGNEVDKLIVEKTIKFIESFNAELSKELRNLISQEVNMNKPFIWGLMKKVVEIIWIKNDEKEKMEIIPCSNEKREREFGRVYLNLPLYRDRHNRLFVIIKGKYEEIQKSYSGYEFLRDNIDVSSVSTFKTFELEQEIKNLKKENEMQSETLAKVKEWYKDTVAKKDQEILELKNQIERLTLNN